jgi:hypothetical protein
MTASRLHRRSRIEELLEIRAKQSRDVEKSRQTKLLSEAHDGRGLYSAPYSNGLDVIQGDRRRM